LGIEKFAEVRKKNKWPINVDIELEYTVPEGSDAVAEVRKCVEFCKAILA